MIQFKENQKYDESFIQFYNNNYRIQKQKKNKNYDLNLRNRGN